MRPAALALCAALVGPHACGPSEADLKRYFEGRDVIARIDLPADGRAIEISADPRRPPDLTELRSRVAASGAAIKNGASATIKHVEVKLDSVAIDLDPRVRFALRYTKGVPGDLTPGAVMAILADYLEFPFTDRVKRPGDKDAGVRPR